MNRYQNGASLIIALFILLVVTILTVSNMSNVVFDNKLATGYMQGKTILNMGDTSSRTAGNFIAEQSAPLELCAETTNKVCLVDSESKLGTYKVEAFDKEKFIVSGDRDQKYNLYWYIYPTADNDQVNLNYGDAMRGIGTYFYEVTSKAENSAENNIFVRSVYSITFN